MTDAPRPHLPWARYVAELAVIVAGVLIALSADAWWQDREDRSREIGYLLAIEADMAEARAIIDTTFTQDSTLASGLTEVLQVLRVPAPLTPEQNDVTRLLPTQVTPFAIPAGTLDALLLSGDLRLIRSEEVRSTLISEAASLERNMAWIDEVTVQAVTNVRAMTVAIEAVRIDAVERATPVDVETLRRSPEIVGSYIQHVTILGNRLASFGGMRGAVDAILESVRAELEQRGERSASLPDDGPS